MFHRGWFWLDVRSNALEQRLMSVIRHYGVTRVGPLELASEEMARDPARWAGVITELDGSSLRTLEELRLRFPYTPMMALLRDAPHARLNILQTRGVEVALVPVDDARVTAFVQRAFASSFLPDERVARLVEGLAQRCQLTAREVQLVSYCLANESRALVRKRLGITENTLKTQVRGLLRKCNERNVDSLAKNLLRAALLLDGPARNVEPLAPWLPVAC
jgi:DNA-binding NarL/FixJ family response regulator